SDKALSGRFSYMTVSDMRTISQRLAPALDHFFNHQTHHRGQAHAILTVLGRPSVPLDLTLFQRSEEGRAFA
ncbi:MAG: damage-inducible protein DinB, partial [Mesorhizobium sp.]